MTFHGRKAELKKISRAADLPKMQNILIYGRRRIGKSALVKEVIRQAAGICIYYECKQTTEANNAGSICRIISEQFNLPKLGFVGIEETLEYVFKLAEKEKILLALDEYAYLANSVKGMNSIMQNLIDRYRETAKITLILSGSYVDTMKSLLQVQSPLYGRFDLVIDLKPMDYDEAAAFYPERSEEDKVRLYAVFGGVPYYNCLIEPRKSVRQNIIDLIASPGARLENEVGMILKTEISKMNNANAVFETLARGYSKFSDILSQSHVSSAPTLVDILEKLIRMDLVKKTVPINDENNRKKSGYVICDPLSNFYYRYNFRYASQMVIMDPEVFYDKYIDHDLETSVIPRQFEEICKQFLIHENRAGRIDPVIEKIGKYWYDDPINHSNGEFDIVTQDEAGYVFYEVKFTKHPMRQKEIDKEIEQVKRCGLDCRQFVFISKAGFEKAPTGKVHFIDLKEIYGNQDSIAISF